MKPVSPVIPGNDAKEILVAKNQPQYGKLPALPAGVYPREGIILTRWELSDSDLEKIKETKSLYLYIWTFGEPVLPMRMAAELIPEIPVID